MPAKKKLNKYQLLIERAVKNTKSFKGSDWAREVKFAKGLYSKFPDKDFLTSLRLDFKLNSLCWFLSKKGLIFLNKQLQPFRLALPEKKKYTYKLGDKILGPKGKAESKPKTILDFLNKDNEKKDEN